MEMGETTKNLGEQIAKLDKHFQYIREHPNEWFNAQTPARQAQLRRQVEDHRRLQRYLGLPETYEKFEVGDEGG